MSFVNNQGENQDDAGLGGIAGLELPVRHDPPARDAPADRLRDGIAEEPYGQRIAKKPLKRLFLGQTAVDFWGKRWRAIGLSIVLVVASAILLSTRGLNLGIDFEGGVAYDVPAEQFSVDEARDVLDRNGLTGNTAKVERRSSASGDIVKVQIEDEPEEVRVAIQEEFAEAAGVDAAEISVVSVSASWGDQITEKAAIALVVFLSLLAVVIAIRFEWRMAVAAIAAMLHDVVVAAGIYSLFGFVVSPATVVAFLTILGYSLYDTIVVFDRVRENERRMAAAGLSAGDLVNVSANQVLMRSLNTSISSVLPVLALLVIGAGILGQVTLREFATALLIGIVIGCYSSIFVATPLLGMLKRSRRTADTHAGEPDHLVGEDLRTVVVRGVGILAPRTSRRRPRSGSAPSRRRAGEAAGEAGDTLVADRPGASSLGPAPTTEQLLGHAPQGPRPRKKKRH